MKPINGYEGLFSITDDGQVYSHRTNRFMKLSVNKRGRTKGYHLLFCTRVNKKSIGMSVHRLVATAYIPNPLSLPQVNHIDGNGMNNHVSNLEWVTAKQNAQHAARNGLLTIHQGVNNVGSKLSEADVRFIRDNYTPYCRKLGSRALAKRFGVSHSVIQYVVGAGSRKTYTNVWCE